MKHKLARILIAGLAMLGYTAAASGADWTTETKVEEALYQALHLIDTSQTIYIAKHPDRFYESESAWAIGKHPSESRVIGYMALDAVGHAAVTATLVSFNAPRWLTRTWELVTIGDSAHCVGNNFRIGIKAQF
jgi:hypothetical protein